MRYQLFFKCLRAVTLVAIEVLDVLLLLVFFLVVNIGICTIKLVVLREHSGIGSPSLVVKSLALCLLKHLSLDFFNLTSALFSNGHIFLPLPPLSTLDVNLHILRYLI